MTHQLDSPGAPKTVDTGRPAVVSESVAGLSDWSVKPEQLFDLMAMSIRISLMSNIIDLNGSQPMKTPAK